MNVIRNKYSVLKYYTKHYYLRLKNITGERFCPCCQHRIATFNNWKHIKGEDCPLCGSARRHRLLYIFLTEHTTLPSSVQKRLLHVAPENSLRRLFKKNHSLEYITADLYKENVMHKMDVTDITFPDESFDFIICNHVLEHVPNDHKAMTEFRRVLKSDGFAVLQVPIFDEKTFEDLTITDPAERLRLFGLEDHVRKYGRDYKERLKKAGFLVNIYEVKDMFSDDQIGYFGLNKNETIYICFKSENGYRNMKNSHAN